MKVWFASALVFLGMVTAARAEIFNWCALGENFELGHEFLQVRRVTLELQGESLGELAAALSEELIRRRLWPAQAARVHVSPYVEGQCGYERAADAFQVTISAEEVAQLRQELQHRGASRPSPTVNTATERAQLRRASPPTIPPNTSRINWIRVFYATNRNSTDQSEAANAFGTEDAERLSWGSVDVSIPHAHEMGQLESPAIWRLEWVADPAKHITLAPRFTPLTPERWREEVGSRATDLGRPGVLLFVHGYNVSFSNGARRAAQLANDIAFKGPTVFYSWPSDGSLIPYMRDEADAFAAKSAMADVLQKITSLSPGLPVYVIAHSMGNRVMLHGLAELVRRDPDAHHSVHQVVMAAPDMGLREFRQILTRELAGTRPRYTLYASDRDLPVNLSKWLHGDQRLGNGGPNVAVFSGVDTIDATAITREFFGINHSYFGDSSTLLSDLFTLVHHGFPPAQRHRLKPVQAKQGLYWSFVP